MQEIKNLCEKILLNLTKKNSEMEKKIMKTFKIMNIMIENGRKLFSETKRKYDKFLVLITVFGISFLNSFVIRFSFLKHL